MGGPLLHAPRLPTESEERKAEGTVWTVWVLGYSPKYVRISGVFKFSSEKLWDSAVLAYTFSAGNP